MTGNLEKELLYNSSMRTATYNKEHWVEILEMDTLRGLAYVRDEDGYEHQVSIESLDDIEDPMIDLRPLELPF